MPPVLALGIPAAVLLAATACTLLAPSDEELMGEVHQAQGGARGGGVGAGGAESGGEPESSGGADSVVTPSPATGGDGSVVPEGGASGFDFSKLIPQDGLALWLMADHGIGLADDGGLAVWADHSLNEADATQSLSSRQAKIAPAANGVPQMVELDGVDDELALPKGFGDFSAGLSVFIVATATNDSPCPSLLHFSNEPEQEDIEIGRYEGSIHYEVGQPDVVGPKDAFVLKQRVLLGVLHAPAQKPELRINGVFMAMGSFTELPVVKSRANNFIGRSLYSECSKTFGGKIGEIIVYSRAVEETEREAIEGYLQSRWSYAPPVTTKPGPGELPPDRSQ